jgi:muramoyltetrapeptide carboxypeptidase
MSTLNQIPDRALRAERALTDLGFVVSYGGRAWLVDADGTAAGTAEDRAADLMEAFLDPAVDAILAADAGLGSRDLLDGLDPAAIAASIKPFIGYCDNVYINQYLATQAGISSLYGCTFMIHLGEAGGPYPETLHYLAAALARHDPLVCTPVPSRTADLIHWYEPELERRVRNRDRPGGWTWLRPGTGRGPFLGGEVTLLRELIDVFGLSLRSAVLFWDVAFHDVAVPPVFKELCDRTDLTGLAGMVVGAHPLIPSDDWAGIVSGLLDEFLPGISYPVVVNADVSHMCPSWTVPFAEEVVLEAPSRIVFPRRPAGPHDGRAPG